MTMPTTRTTREKKGRGVQVSTDPTQETHAYASWWLHRLELRVRSHGYHWSTPAKRQTGLGEVVYQWVDESSAAHTRKTLNIFVGEGESVTYLRLWEDIDSPVRVSSSEEGECTWFDHGLLLWHWLSSSSSS